MSEWIKVEHTTPDKPEVSIMAEVLGIDHDAVVGKLVRWWIWADQQAVNGYALNVTEAFIDRLVTCPGFAAALETCKWLQKKRSKRAGIYSIPNFDRHNGKSAKNRALSRERMRVLRNGDAASVTKPPLEGEGEVEVQQDQDQKRMSANADVCNRIVSHYVVKIHAARLTKGAKAKILARLKTYPEAELLQAINRFAMDAWWMENNAHRGVAWFFRSDDRIEQFLGLDLRPGAARPKTHEADSGDPVWGRKL